MTKQILIAILFGMLVGYFEPGMGPIFAPIGQTFVNLLKMIIVPTLFFSIISSVVSGSRKSSSIAGIAFSAVVMYTISTIFAILSGVLAAKLVINYTDLLQYNIEHFHAKVANNSVVGPNNVVVNSTVIYNENPFINFIISVVPINPLKAFSEGDMIQIIFFALFLGVSIKKTKDNDALQNFIKEMTKATYTMTSFVISLSPIGIFSIFCGIFAKNDKATLNALLAIFITLILGVLFQIVFVYFPILKIFGCRLLFFIKNAFSIQVMAFGTSSSSSCLPYTIKSAKEKLGVSDKVANIVLPLGATMNMDGLAIFLSSATVLISYVIGFDLGVDGYLKMIFATMLLSVGTAGVPNVGLVALYTVTSLIGLKVDVFLLLIGIDRLLDMIRTSVNVTGDVVIASSLNQVKKFKK